MRPDVEAYHRNNNFGASLSLTGVAIGRLFSGESEHQTIVTLVIFAPVPPVV